MSGSFPKKRWSVPERKREKLERKTALQPNHAQERTGERKAKKKNRGEGEGERARARERERRFFDGERLPLWSDSRVASGSNLSLTIKGEEDENRW